MGDGSGSGATTNEPSKPWFELNMVLVALFTLLVAGMGALYLLLEKSRKAIREKVAREKAAREKFGRCLTLSNVLLKETGITRSIASFASISQISQTFRLLLTCKEMLAAEKEIFQGYRLPTVCDMCNTDWWKIYRLIVRTPNSRWLEWLDTSEVEVLMLPESMTDEEMLIMFSGERFSELRTLHLWGCDNITDAGLTEVGRGCPNLQTLNLRGCRNITDTSVMKVARRCSNLQTLILAQCSIITDASLLEVARRCSNLQILNLNSCSNITDASVLEVARRCSNLQSLNLYGCRNITDASVLEVARRCLNLQKFHLSGFWNITAACKNALQQSHPKLLLYDIPYRKSW